VTSLIIPLELDFFVGTTILYEKVSDLSSIGCSKFVLSGRDGILMRKRLRFGAG
jgi:hypothetical protein